MVGQPCAVKKFLANERTVGFIGPKAFNCDVVEQLARLTESQNSDMQTLAGEALEYGKLPAPLSRTLIGFRPTLGWIMVAFLTPFALLHVLIFLLDRDKPGRTLPLDLDNLGGLGDVLPVQRQPER